MRADVQSRARHHTGLTGQQWVAVAMPPLVLGSMLFVFSTCRALLGRRAGYFAAFVIYWVVWCLFFPLWLLGSREVAGLFTRARSPDTHSRSWEKLLLALPPIVGYTFAFHAAVREATPGIVGASVAITLANATGEELLWRGVFVRIFPRRRILGWIYPALGFGLWHLAPLTVYPAAYRGGAASFVGTATLWGLIYGWVAQRTRSLRWTALSHNLLDFSGLGARVYFR